MKKIVVANWKMNPRSLKEAKSLFSGIKKVAGQLRKVKTIICPPFLFLNELQKSVSGQSCVIGAQDLFWKKTGAYTGEISPVMLDKAGINYVIVGHSERRGLGETDDIVNKKVLASLNQNFYTILCVGEKERDEQGDYLKSVKQQIEKSLDEVNKKDLKKLIVTYEPVWAISSKGNSADDSENVHEMYLYVKKVLVGLFGKKQGMEIPILYGGSVDEKNAEVLLREGRVNGFIVGSKSLGVKSFSKIIQIANLSH